MESEMSVAIISLSIVVLCWVVVRINQKLDESVRKFYHSNTLDTKPQWEPNPEDGPAEEREPASTANR